MGCPELTWSDYIRLDADKHEYDEAGRLLSKTLRAKDGKSTLLCAYKYDKLNLRVRAKISGVEGKYKYDKYNQLIAAKGKGTDGEKYDYDYSYDPMGNRQSYDDNGTPYSYQSNSLNQYDAIFNPDGSAVRPEHDLNGNSLKCGTTSLRGRRHRRAQLSNAGTQA